MNFSETEVCTGLAAFSPSGEWLAVAKGSNLSVRETSTGRQIATFPGLEPISSLEWSPDSGFLLCAFLKRATLQVFSISDSQFCGKITSARPLGSARWSPDSKSLIGIQEFQLQLIIWSLTTCAIVAIRSPKHGEAGLDFSRDGRFMALIEKNEGKDQVGVYFTGDWTQVRLFPTETSSAEDLLWTSRGQIVVWEGLLASNCLVYSPEGSLVGKILLEGLTMGVKDAESSGQFLALGLNEPIVRVISTISWKPLADFQHSAILPNTHSPIYQETEQTIPGDFSTAARTTVHFTSLKSLSKPPNTKSSKSFPCPISSLSWSFESRYLATRCELTPCIVHIWSTDPYTLAATLSFLSPIRSLAWSPTRPMLAIATGGGSLYLWSEEGAAICEIPKNPDAAFSVFKSKWNSTGSALLLMDRCAIRMAYPQFEAALSP